MRLLLIMILATSCASQENFDLEGPTETDALLDIKEMKKIQTPQLPRQEFDIRALYQPVRTI